MNYFRKRFKALRENAGLTQQEMADALGMSRSSVGMYENGKREPDFETLEKIADYFNMNMSALIDDPATRDLPDAGIRHFIDDETLAIAQELHDRPDLRMMFNSSRKLSPENITFAAAFIEKLAGSDPNAD